MTYQKIKELLCTAIIVKARQHGKMTTQEVYDKIIEAIEKQIPKKPETRKLTAVYREKFCECGEWLCSTADGKIIGGTESNYCRRCGQRLDWDEEAKK